MAFGKALLTKSRRRSNTPSGSVYFLRAMELLPDVHGLYADPILAVELCCSIALYLQSIDHRNSAFVYLGNALRVALTQGIHRELLTGGDDLEYMDRCRSVWWTVYILDRKFSSLMGAPCAISDDNILVSLPTLTGTSPQSRQALEIHVKLSRLIANVLKIVYGADGGLNRSFVKNVHSILIDLAPIATELARSFEVKPACSESLSRVAATLNLCYHQCVILTTRPLLMCLLKRKLDTAINKSQIRRAHLAGPIKTLLEAAGESANKSLMILSALQFQDLLETFLPFDLENTFSSALVLSLLDVIFPFKNTNQKYLETTYEILDTMIAEGNIPAKYRKQELERLQELLFLTEDITNDDGEATATSCVLFPAIPTEHENVDGLTYSVNPGLYGSATDGILTDNIMSIANMLDYDAFSDSLRDETDWLWSLDTPIVDG